MPLRSPGSACPVSACHGTPIGAGTLVSPRSPSPPVMTGQAHTYRSHTILAFEAAGLPSVLKNSQAFLLLQLIQARTCWNMPCSSCNVSLGLSVCPLWARHFSSSSCATRAGRYNDDAQAKHKVINMRCVSYALTSHQIFDAITAENCIHPYCLSLTSVATGSLPRYLIRRANRSFSLSSRRGPVWQWSVNDNLIIC